MVNSGVGQVVILAGGLGSRLGALTKNTPKPLLEINGTSFIKYQIAHYKCLGFQRFLILCGPFEEQFRSELLGTRGFPDTEIQFCPEKTPAGTAGALFVAAKYLDPTFVLLNGDTFFPITNKCLNGALITPHFPTMFLAEVDDCLRFGRVILKNGFVTKFDEKGVGGSGWINAGVYILRRSFFQSGDRSHRSLEYDMMPGFLREPGIKGQFCKLPFLDIGTPEDFKIASNFLAENNISSYQST